MKIAIIGAGAMGGALAEGILKNQVVDNASSLTVSDVSSSVLEKFKQVGAQTTTDNSAAVKDADFVAVVVKPWLTQQVLEGIKDALDYSFQQLIVIAAGITSEDICSWMAKETVPSQIPLCLAIPNIAIAVGSSMTFLVPIGMTKEQTDAICALFDQMGSSVVVEERLLSAGTTLASCGIAYAMRYIRASVEGGVELGFKSAIAQKIVEQTVKGAVDLLQATHAHPEAKIDEVTTPGGVTIKGLNEMEHAGFTSAVIRGLKDGLK